MCSYEEFPSCVDPKSVTNVNCSHLEVINLSVEVNYNPNEGVSKEKKEIEEDVGNLNELALLQSSYPKGLLRSSLMEHSASLFTNLFM